MVLQWDECQDTNDTAVPEVELTTLQDAFGHELRGFQPQALLARLQPSDTDLAVSINPSEFINF